MRIFAEKIKYYLAHDTEREKIRQAGYRRAINEHSWQKRFQEAFKQMELITLDEAAQIISWFATARYTLPAGISDAVDRRVGFVRVPADGTPGTEGRSQPGLCGISQGPVK